MARKKTDTDVAPLAADEDFDLQSFWLMGQPDVDVRKRKDGRYEVEVNGFD